MLKKTIGVVALALCAGIATAAPQADIVQTAVSAGSFKTLVQAVQAAGLAETLEGKGPFTVFAPTDDAFAKLPPGTLDSLLKPENRDKLKSILLYHVVAGRLNAAQVAHMHSIKTVEGAQLRVQTVNGMVMIDNAKVVQADVGASNGVIHVIDTVLMPPGQ